jgi:hypothetical protein
MSSGIQTLYVTVTRSGQLVQGATVMFTVNYSTGPQTLSASPTGADGKTQHSWDVGSLSGGYDVSIQVRATHSGQTATTSASFYVP